MRCESCGTDNPSQNRFCQQCGSPLQSTGEAQQPRAESPSTPSQPQTLQHVTTGATRLDKLGTRIDGWADLVDGCGDRAEMLFQFVHQRLGERELPQVNHRVQSLSLGGLAGEKRRYQLVAHQVGSSIALYIAGYGQDLYVAWDLFVRQVWKWTTFAMVVGIAAAISLITAQDNRYGFQLTGWLLNTLLFSFGFLVLVGVAGRILKNSFWAFFRNEYNHFRADDVTAMMLATHHSLLEGLDHIGVDRALIRPKESYHAGRRERII